MDFIDRIDEQERLQRALSSDKPEFVVLYGRRRLGKSTLIRKVLKDNDVYYEASLAEKATQIELLAHTIGSVYTGFDVSIYTGWENIILAFNRYCDENATLVLDEFPLMVFKDPSLPSTLQRVVDRRIIGGEGLRCNIIICGSSQRMMQTLIKSSEPLYGRAEEEFCLKPIRLPYWYDEMKMDAKSLIEEYSVWGGVPQYWSYRSNCRSLRDAIQKLILTDNGVLLDEPSKLFLDDAMDVAPYSSIMTAIGSGRHRYSSIADAMGKKTAELGKPINNLIEMAFIRREVPFGESPKKSKKTLYQIDDPFLSFYYKFIEPNKSSIVVGRRQRVEDKIKKGFPEHVGKIWESLCQLAVSGNDLFGHPWDMASRWWGKAPVYEEGKKTPVGFEDLEFDVVAQDYEDKNTILVGECKWASTDYADRLLEKLKAKTSKAPFAQGKNIVYVLFLREKPKSQADCNIMLPEDVIKALPR